MALSVSSLATVKSLAKYIAALLVHQLRGATLVEHLATFVIFGPLVVVVVVERLLIPRRLPKQGI